MNPFSEIFRIIKRLREKGRIRRRRSESRRVCRLAKRRRETPDEIRRKLRLKDEEGDYLRDFMDNRDTRLRGWRRLWDELKRKCLELDDRAYFAWAAWRVRRQAQARGRARRREGERLRRLGLGGGDGDGGGDGAGDGGDGGLGAEAAKREEEAMRAVEEVARRMGSEASWSTKRGRVD